MLEILHGVFAWTCSASAATDVGLVAIAGLSTYLVLLLTLTIDLPWSKAPLKSRPDPFAANRLASANLKQLIADIRARPPIRTPGPLLVRATTSATGRRNLQLRVRQPEDEANHPTIHCNRF